MTPPPDLSIGNGSFAAAHDVGKRGSGAGVVESESPSPMLNQQREVFIRSFIFQPDLPIRIDYEAKGFKTEMVGFFFIHVKNDALFIFGLGLIAM